MRIIRNIEVAKTTLLHRPSPDEYPATPALRQKIKEVFGEELSLLQVVDRIIADVRARGDQALFDYTRKIDGVKLDSLEVGQQEIAAADSKVDREVASALELAAQRIREFHQAQKKAGPAEFHRGGLGCLVRPLERVGLYIPGGAAAYPSTVLMSVIPARVAGVGEVILATPPGPGGVVPAATLVAAGMAGADRIFRVGGAQAIAALALGTETIPRVDKICGPGNIFVTLAKKRVYGLVDIDGLYGPTETLIIADESADPALCAADLLSQAEHDPMASAILITTSPALAEAVSREVEGQLARLERRTVATQSLENRGGIVVVNSLETALELANLYAPEHLCLMVRDARSYIGKVRHAGGIFIDSPEALGDYTAGPSHVMPTGGTARFSSPLGVKDFLKAVSLVALDEAALKKLGPAAATLARAEGLTAHAQAIEMRLGKKEGQRARPRKR